VLVSLRPVYLSSFVNYFIFPFPQLFLASVFLSLSLSFSLSLSVLFFLSLCQASGGIDNVITIGREGIQKWRFRDGAMQLSTRLVEQVHASGENVG